MSDATLIELRRIRAALERPHVEPVYVSYEVAAKMLCTSKRSIERLVSEKRIKTYDIAGPKLRVSELRALGDAKSTTARRASRPSKKPSDLMERVKTRVLERERQREAAAEKEGPRE